MMKRTQLTMAVMMTAKTAELSSVRVIMYEEGKEAGEE